MKRIVYCAILGLLIGASLINTTKASEEHSVKIVNDMAVPLQVMSITITHNDKPCGGIVFHQPYPKVGSGKEETFGPIQCSEGPTDIEIEGIYDPGQSYSGIRYRWRYIIYENHQSDKEYKVNPTAGGGERVSIVVGGVSIQIGDPISSLVPYYGLTSAILFGAAATSIYVKRVKSREEKQ
jgi:hypothetical protein